MKKNEVEKKSYIVNWEIHGSTVVEANDKKDAGELVSRMDVYKDSEEFDIISVEEDE